MALSRKPQEIVEDSTNPLLSKHESWGRIPVGKIADILNGFAFKSSKFNKEKGIPLIRIRDVGKNSSDTYYDGEYDETYIVQDGDLLIGMDGDFRAAIWKGGKALLNQRVCKISLKSNDYDFKFLSYAIQPYLDAIHAETSAVTVKHLSSNSISEIPLPLPPLEQQKRIVAKIEELFSHIDAGIDALKKAKQLLKQYRQSVLKAAVTGELTKEWREANKDKLEPASKLLERILKERRQKWEEQQLEEFKAKGKVPRDDKWKEKYIEPKQPELHDLPELSDNWQYVRLDVLTEIQGGLTVDRKREKTGTLKIPYLRVANVQRGYLDLSEMKEIAVPEERIKGLLLQDGDILFNEGGDRDKLGRGWVWHNEVNPCTYQNHVFRARPYTKEIIPEFISMFGNTFGQDYFMKQGKQTTNLASINKTKLSDFPVPLCSRKEMNEIMTILDTKITNTDRMDKSIERLLLKADRDKQSILSSAFRGELVKYIDTDWSASELLEKIYKNKTTLILTTKKENKRNFTTRNKAADMKRREIIEILKSEKKPLSTEILFQLTGLDGSSPDDIEEFYQELKKSITDKNVITEEIEVDGVKQGNNFFYKVSK